MVSVLLSNPVRTAAGAGALVVGFESAIPTFYRPIKERAPLFAGLTDSKKTQNRARFHDALPGRPMPALPSVHGVRRLIIPFK